MACHLKRFSYIADFKTACNYLGLGLNPQLESAVASGESKQVEQDLDGWNNNWEWGMDASQSPDQPMPNGYWPPSACMVSMSCFADTLVVAHGQHAIFLTSKWGKDKSSEEKLGFSVASSKRLTAEPNEMVTSVLCIPLVSQRRSQLTGPDWTSVAVGFSSGFLRIYTQEGELLLSQCLREGAVRRLLYQSSSSHSEGSLGDLVAVCGQSCVITLDAFTFLQTVKACRSHLARAKAGQSPMLQPPMLVYKKWLLQDFTDLTDCCLLGPTAQSPFDQLVWESLRGGPGSYPKMLSPSTNILLSAGLNCFLGTFYFTETGGQINLSDVMGAVTNKIKTALLPQSMVGKFNLWGKTPSSDEQVPVEPATSVTMRYGFYDKRRKGLSLLLSPNGLQAVLTDSFGRVLLVDVLKGICSRMWKGYRDAQCGWVEYEEEELKKSKSKSGSQKPVFLIIYAPRRGILEVWSVPQVFRIAAFTVSKSALLLCPGYCVMGTNLKDLPRSLLYPCCLLEPDGNIATIHIPFNTALRMTKSCPQKDVYLLTDLQQVFREKKDTTEQEFKDLFLNIHSVSVLQKAVNMVLSEEYVSCQCLQECLSNFITHRASVTTGDGYDALEHVAKHLLCLLTTFSRFRELGKQPGPTPTGKLQTPDTKVLSETLNLSSDEVDQMKGIISRYQDCASSTTGRSRITKRVSFTEPHLPITYKDFVKAFDWSAAGEKMPCDQELSNDWRKILGSFMFEAVIQDEKKLPCVVQTLRDSSLKPQDLLDFLLYYWMSRKDTTHWDLCMNLFQLMQGIAKIGPLDWSQLLPVLSSSTNPPGAYMACIMLRTLIYEMTEGPSAEHSKTESGEWETLTEEHVRWNLLQRRLEDLVMLESLLRCRGQENAPNISVQNLLDKGQGAVSEVIAEWIVKSNMDMQLFLETTQPKIETSLEGMEDKQAKLFKDTWCQVRDRFPRSLDHDSMLANCCWEQMVVWSKEPDDIKRLTNALETLAPITSAILKNGVGCMMWKTFVVSRFEALALLIEKVGKTPKERLCKQDLSMSAIYLEPFLEFCSQLLEIIIEANVVSEVESLPQFPPEDLWRESTPEPPSGSSTPLSTGSAGLPLVVLAYNQSPSNYVLLYHHNLLANALLLIVTFGLKNTRPLSFYDLKGRQCFFSQLQGPHEVPQTSLPFKVMMGRTNFLQRVASAIAHSLPDSIPPTQIGTNFPEPDDLVAMEQRRIREREASRWLNRSLELAKGWDVSLDEIRRHYICQLYSCGHDLLAEECLSSVFDYLSLGSQLLLLAGQRVATVLLGPGHDEAARLAYLPPLLSKWLKALDLSQLKNPVSSLSATKQLLAQAINLTAEDSPENKRALALLDALVTEKVVFPS